MSEIRVDGEFHQLVGEGTIVIMGDGGTWCDRVGRIQEGVASGVCASNASEVEAQGDVNTAGNLRLNQRSVGDANTYRRNGNGGIGTAEATWGRTGRVVSNHYGDGSRIL